MGEDELVSLLDRRVWEERENEPWEELLFNCFESNISSSISLVSLLDTSDGLTENSKACVTDLISNTDIGMIIAGEQPSASADDLTVAAEFYGGLMSCRFLGFVENINENGEYEPCLANVLIETDRTQIYLGNRPDTALQEMEKSEKFMGEMVSCFDGHIRRSAIGEVTAPQ